MAEPNQTGNGTPGAPQMHVRVVGQYIKDFSFENPNVDKLVGGNVKDTNIKADIRVETKQVGPDLYESAVILRAEANASIGVVYETELVYAGLFQIKNAPPQALEPILHINCPTLLFPYVRRIIADMTREGGFQPLLLDPYDFAGLLAQQRRAAQAGAGGAGTPPVATA